MNVLGRVLFLVSVWVMLWGALTVANVLSGVMVTLLVLAVSPTVAPGVQHIGRPRPLAVLRLMGAVGRQLVTSNIVLAREVVTPGSRITTGVVACRLRTDSPTVVALLSNIVALSPGMVPVHVQIHPAVLYVHVLHLRDPVAARLAVAHLESLCTRAFGTPAEIARLGESLEHQGAGLQFRDEPITDAPRTGRQAGHAAAADSPAAQSSPGDDGTADRS